MRFGRRVISMRRRLGLVAFLTLAALALAAPAVAQIRAFGETEERDADDDLKAAIIDSVAYAYNKTYVFEDVAEEMEKHIREKLKDGDYDEFETVSSFTRQLTEDLREISNDRHIGVAYVSPMMLEQFEQDDEDPELEHQREFDRLSKVNFQFKKVEIMDGNVGYLKLDGFTDTSYSGATAIAAMNFLGYTDALIVDLRENGGGSPSLIQTMMAYLLEDSTHLNSFYIREGDSLRQFWSTPYVPGPKMHDVDLYVLTSQYTFSGAEEFTYNVKNLERGTIVGEVTGGGAHPVSTYLFPSLNVGARVPFGRAVNPISGTNWEGTGIEPDVEVPADDALDTAYLMALEKLREGDVSEEDAFALDWAIDGLDAKLHPIEVDEATLARYAGDYGPRHLIVEEGKLIYQRDERDPHHAIPMTETLFRFEQIPFFRLEVVLDDDGNPVKLVGHYDNARTDENPRD